LRGSSIYYAQFKLPLFLFETRNCLPSPTQKTMIRQQSARPVYHKPRRISTLIFRLANDFWIRKGLTLHNGGESDLAERNPSRLKAAKRIQSCYTTFTQI